MKIVFPSGWLYNFNFPSGDCVHVCAKNSVGYVKISPHSVGTINMRMRVRTIGLSNQKKEINKERKNFYKKMLTKFLLFAIL